MRKAKKFLCMVLILGILLTTGLSSAAFAATDSFQSDTTHNFVLAPGKTYTLKLTPTNSKSVIVVSTGNSKAISVVSNVKKGNDYYATIKAIGTVGNSVGVFAGIKGQTSERLFIVTIAVTSQHDNSTPLEPPYGIVESSVGYITKVGILEPFAINYDPSFSFEEHENAINKNMDGCDLVNDGFVKSSLSTAFVNFIQKDGKYGLLISAWRKRKSDNSDAGILNGVLSAMVYLSGTNGKECGEALWAFNDSSSCGEKTNCEDFGFTDSNPTSGIGTLTYKDGTHIDYKEENGQTTFLFTPKQ